ncbi:coiled-coil domain-containing protein 171-like isoform X1 [Hemibagrus wyckioides]|uniref:coiled-coil domain-containing protein 171-like isoform X1 n=1 Tax=Hemibagrus wyckioides TaxID=337641 RepID=UPI00266BD3E6|nr:coiled-coil domain-containing protein 171-like isoform X1 [Hemibagrus wyckioides]XP_058266720.1 coiled-coil domain-containing protein 171-like isoform X1 [Hemibagrus wyckioides]XP_058266721.1 coiled-coil domain-containing protein 171-like isoform X1 [Hemibagrus wyckioides]XP_058266722.1 coiled-coil domain-containing protein 171-like isoform X1 [Hemibagrus wyckioides]
MSESRQTQRGDDRARDRARRRESGQSKALLRASHPHTLTRSTQGDLQEISRLREEIGQMQTETRGFDKEEELRWKINQLEQDKLKLNSEYNQELSGYEAQLTRCRALLEKGEAQRQTLEYELAVLKRDAAAQKSRVEKKMADLITHNQQLEGLNVELHQRASDLQRALEITQQARLDDEQRLHAELRERDHLIHSISTEKELLQEENRHRDTLLQEQKDTLQELKGRMDSMQKDRERDAEELRVRRAELRNSMVREEKMKKELETAIQRVKVLERSVESEKAAHLEMKLCLRDVEAALSVEKRNQAEVVSSLELLKHKYGEVDRAHTRERERADNTQHTLTLLEQEYRNTNSNLIGQLEKTKADLADLIGQLEHEKAASAKLIGQLEHEKAESAKLIGQLEHEKAESAKLIGQLEHEKAESAKLIGQLEHEKAESAKLSIRLQKQERVETERGQELILVQKRLAFVEDTYEGLLKEMEQLLHHHKGAPPIITTTGDKQNPSALMDILRRVLHNYHTELKDLVKAVDALNKENKDKDEIISDQRRCIQEFEARCMCLREEVERLHVCVEESADAAKRGQMELQTVTHFWEEEKERHTHTKTHINTLIQEHEKEQQEKLAFLHSLYQRLLTGCVLVAPPQSMMGSFSWAELSIMLQEQADALTSDLNSANQRIARLDCVCEGKEAALKSVCEQLKQREKSWIKQREDLDKHHTHLINELQTKAQDLKSRLYHAEECLCISEHAHSALQQDVSRLQELVRVCRRENASFLAASAMLAGCVYALHGRVSALVHQKTLLQQSVCDAEFLKQELRALLYALSDPGVKGQSRLTGSVWKFRVHVVAVMAALRLRNLCRNTHILFRVGAGVCVSKLRLSNTHTEEEESETVMKMLTSSQLCVILHTCMQEVQTELQRTEHSAGVLAAARSSFSKLVEKLLPKSESGCYGDMGSLAQQLGQGLNSLRKTHHLALRHNANKVMFSALQQHFLEFTQRLHSAEVERRDLRIELSRLKRRNTHTHDEMKDNTHTVCVPLRQFHTVCDELSSALCREQQAQALLHEQATQLQELGITMETHISEQLEKDHTLAQAVQSLSDAKAELKRKEQSLRLLGKRLSQSQEEKQELQQSINRVENTLHLAARSKECLLSYIMSVECRLRELKDSLLLSHSNSLRDRFTLHLPTVHQDQGLELDSGAPEMKACQSLVHSFTDVYEFVCSKVVCLEREISSYQSHVTALKAELHDACIRENQCYQLIGSTDTPAPLSEAEGNCGIPAPLSAAVSVNDVPRNMDTLLNKSTVPLKKGRSVKKASKSSRSVKSASKPST